VDYAPIVAPFNQIFHYYETVVLVLEGAKIIEVSVHGKLLCSLWLRNGLNSIMVCL
jgi:hypothetical protein